MAKSQTMGTAAELRRAQKLLKQYETTVAEVTKEFMKARRSIKALGTRFSEGASESEVVGLVMTVVNGHRPVDATFVDALRELSRVRLFPIEEELSLKRDQYNRLVSERKLLGQTKTLTRKQILNDSRAVRSALKSELNRLQSAFADSEKLIQRSEGRLRSLESDLARRERGLLRWFEKTDSLRAEVDLLKKKIINQQTKRDGIKDQLIAAESGIANAAADLRTSDDHPDIRGINQRIAELALQVQETKSSLDKLGQHAATVRKRFGNEVVSEAENRYMESSQRLVAAIRLVPQLYSPIPETHWLNDSWLAECRKQRDEANVLISKPNTALDSQETRSRRESIVKSLIDMGDRRDRQKHRLAREKEKREVKRQQEAAASMQREMGRALRQQEAANEALAEFEREKRRLESRLEQVERARDRAEARVVRVLTQLFVKNATYTKDYVHKNRSKFPAYDNAKASLADLNSERALLRRKLSVRSRLEAAKSEADRRLATEIRKQSSATKRKTGPAPRIEVNEWEDAERLAELYMRHLGFRDARRTSVGPDGGVDVESADAVAQVKDQSNPVGRHLIQQLYGVARSKDKKALFFARRYAPQAMEWARDNGVTLYIFNRAGDVEAVH